MKTKSPQHRQVKLYHNELHLKTYQLTLEEINKVIEKKIINWNGKELRVKSVRMVGEEIYYIFAKD